MTLLDQLAAGRAKSLADLAKGNTRLGKLLQREGVPASAELERVLRLPRRTWETDPQAEELRVLLTQHLKKPEGTQELKLAQAVALGDIHDTGLFGPIKVGVGKTLIGYLAPTLVGAKRPVLLAPAKHMSKPGIVGTIERHHAQISKHWREPPPIRMFSYNELGLEQNAELLQEAAPDLIIADEAHKLCNRDAAVTRRVERWLTTAAEKGKPCRFVPLSGTLQEGRAIEEYHHLMRWALIEHMPLPASLREAILWSRALDKKTPISARMDVGALVALDDRDDPPECDDEVLGRVREGFERRIYQSPGVVHTRDVEVAASLQIELVDLPMSSGMRERIGNAWRGFDPEGMPIEEEDAPNLVSQLSLDFYYKDEPGPPAEWVEARKKWRQVVRLLLDQRNPEMESPLQVEIAAAMGKLGQIDAWDRWRRVRDMHRENNVPKWQSYDVIDEIAKLARSLDEHVLIWTLYHAPGDALRERHGFRYFRHDACDAQGHVEESEGIVVCSVASCAEGQNLQHRYHTNLVLTPPGPQLAEQLIGRTHRQLQPADNVRVFGLVHTPSYRAAWQKLREGAEGTSRLAIADWV